MSARPAGAGAPLWWIRPVDPDLRIDDAHGHAFAGDDDAMARHIAELHRTTGRQHAATRVET